MCIINGFDQHRADKEGPSKVEKVKQILEDRVSTNEANTRLGDF